MTVEINKDIEKYKESVFMGLNARQMICIILALAAGTGIVVLTYPFIGITGSAYVAVPVVAPIGLMGFYSYNGMSFIEVTKRRLRFMFKNRPLLYRSTENEKNGGRR